MLKRMSLYISTGDGVVGYGAVYLYWRRCGTLPHCSSTGDGPVKYGAVDHCWGRCARVCRCRSLLGTLWQEMGR